MIRLKNNLKMIELLIITIFYCYINKDYAEMQSEVESFCEQEPESKVLTFLKENKEIILCLFSYWFWV